MLWSFAALALYTACAWFSGRDRLLALAPLLLVSCTVIGWVEDGAKTVGGEVGGTVAEVTICPLGLIACGQVWLCAQPADNPLGHVEICVDDEQDIADVEAVYGHCEHTPRHQGLCKVCCSGDCGPGANAYNGTYCP